MNKFILAASLLASASSFANDNQLFGEYPAKYFCIKKNRKVVKCFMPTVEEMNAEILKYESGVDERKQKLDDFLDQVTPHKNEIIRIANEYCNLFFYSWDVLGKERLKLKVCLNFFLSILI